MSSLLGLLPLLCDMKLRVLPPFRPLIPPVPTHHPDLLWKGKVLNWSTSFALQVDSCTILTPIEEYPIVMSELALVLKRLRENKEDGRGTYLRYRQRQVLALYSKSWSVAKLSGKRRW